MCSTSSEQTVTHKQFGSYPHPQSQVPLFPSHPTGYQNLQQEALHAKEMFRN